LYGKKDLAHLKVACQKNDENYGTLDTMNHLKSINHTTYDLTEEEVKNGFKESFCLKKYIQRQERAKGRRHSVAGRCHGTMEMSLWWIKGKNIVTM
jgi:hypothetical protein